ncbi:MAG: hypothetical protein DHS20C13_02060 [Thermodesulfobacteriota bacterium]|nr:MAG: hypothetical protein DHS20C13_02060 [Thermodesulfobacteriota bacterium]
MSKPQSINLKTEIPEDISTEIFIKNWTIYRKIIENDNMSHKAGYSRLRETLVREMDKPFSFLDLACGDAFYSSRTLKETKARQYIGIDVSAQALSLAKEELQNTQLEAKFIRADFINFRDFIETPQDVIWVGFSVHHLDTPDKLEFMKKVRETLSEDGIFMLYEPIFIEGEDRDLYFKRFKKTYNIHWNGLTKEEGESLLEHVRESEKPETRENWIKLGREAGFLYAEKVFSEKTGLYELFKFK